jgi:hypothetical protein
MIYHDGLRLRHQDSSTAATREMPVDTSTPGYDAEGLLAEIAGGGAR